MRPGAGPGGGCTRPKKGNPQHQRLQEPDDKKNLLGSGSQRKKRLTVLFSYSIKLWPPLHSSFLQTFGLFPFRCLDAPLRRVASAVSEVFSCCARWRRAPPAAAGAGLAPHWSGAANFRPGAAARLRHSALQTLFVPPPTICDFCTPGFA